VGNEKLYSSKKEKEKEAYETANKKENRWVKYCCLIAIKY
jgi:hypothetical protein